MPTITETQLELLTEARDLIAQPDGWTQGEFHRVGLFLTGELETQEFHQYCTVGALNQAWGTRHDALDATGSTIAPNASYLKVSWFNSDDPTHRLEEGRYQATKLLARLILGRDQCSRDVAAIDGSLGLLMTEQPGINNAATRIIYHWNDDPFRTQAEVVTLFDDAIAHLQVPVPPVEPTPAPEPTPEPEPTEERVLVGV